MASKMTSSKNESLWLQEHFNKYEKALYASLAGIVGPVIPICRTYMDFIWAYLKALSHQIIEREIK